MSHDDIFNEHHTPADLARLRAKSVADHAADGIHVAAFTCDECPSKSCCIFVFDGYNTDGDCLADK